jgi:LemA protein
MKKWLIPLIVIAIAAFGIYQWAVGFNNTAVEYEADAKTAWSNVESAYQRRSDLYNTVVKTVQGSADFERNTLNEVIEARSKATSINIDAGDLTPEKMEAFQKAQSQLSGSFSRLIASFERYPDLKTTSQFREFQAQQEGTENRINTARDRYNKAVNKYDIYTTKFPNKILAGMFGFKEMARYKSDPGSENVPDIEFKNN